jgi:hypothetical protein
VGLRGAGGCARAARPAAAGVGRAVGSPACRGGSGARRGQPGLPRREWGAPWAARLRRAGSCCSGGRLAGAPARAPWAWRRAPVCPGAPCARIRPAPSPQYLSFPPTPPPGTTSTPTWRPSSPPSGRSASLQSSCCASTRPCRATRWARATRRWLSCATARSRCSGCAARTTTGGCGGGGGGLRAGAGADRGRARAWRPPCPPRRLPPPNIPCSICQTPAFRLPQPPYPPYPPDGVHPGGHQRRQVAALPRLRVHSEHRRLPGVHRGALPAAGVHDVQKVGRQQGRQL